MSEEYKPTGPAKYGNFYWCIKTKLSSNGEIYVHADSVSVTENGSLQMQTKKEFAQNLIIAQGQWTAVFAASLLDGSAVAVEHWKGEVQR
jgi:hypothetical protein